MNRTFPPRTVKKGTYAPGCTVRSSRARFTRRTLAMLLVGLLLLAAGFLFSTGRVIQVVDGDTLVVHTGMGKMQRIRLYGIDAPENGQAGGKDASAFATDLLFLQKVSLSVLNEDSYGRSVALVRLVDGELANEAMVRAGHAWVYRNYCKEAFCAHWYALERRAKKQGLGLWGRRNPTPPWQWRRANPR